MPRTKDRWIVSEAIRTQEHPLWRISSRYWTPGGGHCLELITDYAERLLVRYGPSGVISYASYTHYDEDGKVVCFDQITKNKRKRVLKLIREGSLSEH